MNTITNFHVYFTGQLVLAPLSKDENGLWVEVEPVSTRETVSLQSVKDALAELLPVPADNPRAVAWDGNAGQVWDSASHFLGVRQFDDGSWQVLPFIPRTKDDGGLEWNPDRERAVILKPPANTIDDVARAILKFYA